LQSSRLAGTHSLTRYRNPFPHLFSQPVIATRSQTCYRNPFPNAGSVANPLSVHAASHRRLYLHGIPRNWCPRARACCPRYASHSAFTSVQLYKCATFTSVQPSQTSLPTCCGSCHQGQYPWFDLTRSLAAHERRSRQRRRRKFQSIAVCRCCTFHLLASVTPHMLSPLNGYLCMAGWTWNRHEMRLAGRWTHSKQRKRRNWCEKSHTTLRCRASTWVPDACTRRVARLHLAELHPGI
jgi:hypothetical protein